jgi:hypothetical protein
MVMVADGVGHALAQLVNVQWVAAEPIAQRTAYDREDYACCDIGAILNAARGRANGGVS